ncbi:unnamed protein product [Penicillium pancosmium]
MRISSIETVPPGYKASPLKPEAAVTHLPYRVPSQMGHGMFNKCVIIADPDAPDDNPQAWANCHMHGNDIRCTFLNEAGPLFLSSTQKPKAISIQSLGTSNRLMRMTRKIGTLLLAALIESLLLAALVSEPSLLAVADKTDTVARRPRGILVLIL